jgi:hypothetical protein
MTSALVGYTGFVGSNLMRQRTFGACFNSKNFKEMTGRAFTEVICAGVSAVKWKANKEPEQDLAGIRALQEVLSTVSVDRFILISTIDVYPRTADADEDFDCHSLANHAYGTHRLAFEDFCRSRFADCLVVRLPGLFGPGLKKNVIFDLLANNCLEMINRSSSFQYYDLARLSADIERASTIGLSLINLFTEPLATSEIIDSLFAGKQVGQKPSPEAHYDLHTRHAHHWGKNGRYIYSKLEILDDLRAYLNHATGANR